MEFFFQKGIVGLKMVLRNYILTDSIIIHSLINCFNLGVQYMLYNTAFLTGVQLKYVILLYLILLA